MPLNAASKAKKKWLIFIPVVIGVTVLLVLVKSRSGPEQAPVVEESRAVRIIEVPSVTVVPRALAYGTVKPAKVWEAVAEVSGEVIEMHPQLKKGIILLKDSVLMRIDPTEYELVVAQTEADIQATQAELVEKQVKEANTRASLAIEEEALQLGEKELERKRRLIKQGTISSSEFEQQKRTVLSQRQIVQAQKNTLNLIPVERRLLQAQRARFQAQLEQARLDLAHTAIRMPFDGRIAEMNIERTEYIRQGDVLVVADSIDTAEVEAQVPITRMRGLIKPQKSLPVEIGPGVVEKVLGLKATVRLQDLNVEWEGRVNRVSDTIDPQTRTVGVIVEVDEPYRQAQPGIRPPLVKGMFVEVELRGKPRSDVLIIPRSALHGGLTYVVHRESRLAMRKVEIGLIQPGFAVIKTGLQAGERVVISDLIPAIEGMALDPVLDQDALAQLLKQAAGIEE